MKRDIKRLRRWCIRRKIEGWKVERICAHARVPGSTFYVWWNKYQEGGFSNLEPKSRRPKNIQRTEDNIVSWIVEVRIYTGWNEKAISATLKLEGIKIGHSTVYRVLSGRGLINHLSKPRKQRTYRHWSRRRPNSLWQVDLCIHKRHWVAAFLGDCSRFLTGIGLFKQGTTQNILDLFKSSIDRHGKPREVLSDHGTQFYASQGQKSRFTRFCEDNEIRHILGGIGKPTTLGKVERFNRTFKELYPRFNDLEQFVQYYNFKKPHRGLDYATPASIYLG
ncbi:MAG: DDE-type integrase/transposase/recombinase [Candidatus Hydrothermarchaeales archaeon]